MTTLFCKDCRHFRPNSGIYGVAICDKPMPTDDYFVSGETQKLYCTVQRTSRSNDYCGPTAKFFEPKEQT